MLAATSSMSVTQAASEQTGLGTGPLPIIALTTIGPDGSGYLADPQPVHLAPSEGDRRALISGTTKAVISCAEPITPRCFRWTPLTVDAGPLMGAITKVRARITNYQNIDLFQDDGGGWHAVVTIGVQTPAHQAHWTVITHAHPVGPSTPGVVPLAWSADTVLAGSFDEPVEGNYDAKYLVDGGKLYLLYVRNYVPEPALRNEIVIQPMSSPTRPASGGPVVLLTPGDRYGALNSEWYANTQAKLVEAPFISRIGGKYALVYSTGAYLTAGYKAAVAWSDTLLPAQGRHYRKVLEPDLQNIWATPSGIEVTTCCNRRSSVGRTSPAARRSPPASHRPCRDRGAPGGWSSTRSLRATCRSARTARSRGRTADPMRCA